ncbi:MBL fold metallo-hydrolase [Aliiglaciecola sp. CAU 1673]|uniref:MBL fold metallo-hydrolase n=1 Tax=Aliiglaciecola sp. CAU 1673 TaxID=3032595 RepID=UPI0023D9DD67|nr:MBL fold metallo-hydrolase [Aliiglaciecola sp. CAU 1673]MDF2177027.1 MBL fold metallo-hydrolase [Aliiglaciecola sp. CAU 1673]
MKALIFTQLSLFLAILLAGCATPNQVTQITAQPPTAKLATDNRYQNLYPGKKEYPLTCETDCYLPHPDVDCKEPAQQCHYVGPQRIPPVDSGFKVQWLGHASFAIESPDGQQVLIDPVSGQFDWPVNWAANLLGTSRNKPKWLSDKTLQKTKAVLYSHLHYDHFNKADIGRIGNQAQYFVGLNSASHFEKAGYQIKEMDWFASSQLGDTTIHAVPAHHFNGRIWVPFLYGDNEQSLWTGWLIEHSGKKLYFAGDTGYSDHFKDIQARYGDIDVCLIPIASYHHEEHGEWYRYVHTTPEDALTAAEELGCKVMIPWGYGNASWQMGDHSSHSALLRLLNMKERMLSTVNLLILNEGEQVTL